MRRRPITMRLTRADLDQLLQYIQSRDEGDNGGWYCGNRENFEKRHEYLLWQIMISLELFDLVEPTPIAHRKAAQARWAKGNADPEMNRYCEDAKLLGEILEHKAKEKGK